MDLILVNVNLNLKGNYKMIAEKVITHTNWGLYVVENGELLMTYTYKDMEEDNWVQVSDLTDLLDSEYKTLDFMLRLNYGYKLNGRFL